MRWSCRSGRVTALAGISALLIAPAIAAGQENPEKKSEESTSKIVNPAGADPEVQRIDNVYNEQRLQLERRRLESLAQLAARQDPAAAAATYEHLFRVAISNNLFADAAPMAEAVVKNGSSSPTTLGLAHLVKIIAESDRGAHEQSLESLRRVVEGIDRTAGGKASHPAILTSEKVELCDLYYQRLVHGDQLQVAKKAFQLLKEHVRDPALVEYVSNRLKRLDLVGKPAPAIRGTDLDGKAFDLADAKGKVVLVVFWASWCLPCADEIEGLQQVAEAYRANGFRIVGINVDSLQDGGQKLETVMPNIRRFLLDYNVRWPTLINGSGDKNFAEAYGVTAIPSNTLIGRDGTVIHLDLVHKNLATVIARATRQ